MRAVLPISVRTAVAAPTGVRNLLPPRSRECPPRRPVAVEPAGPSAAAVSVVPEAFRAAGGTLAPVPSSLQKGLLEAVDERVGKPGAVLMARSRRGVGVFARCLLAGWITFGTDAVSKEPAYLRTTEGTAALLRCNPHRRRQ